MTSSDVLMLQLRDEASPENISPIKFAAALDCPLQELEVLARVHRITLHNNLSSPDLQRYLHDSLRVLQAAADLRGNVGEALLWFRNNPIGDFACKTPARLV